VPLICKGCTAAVPGANDATALSAAAIGVALRGGIQSILESAHVFIDKGGIEKILLLQRIAIRYRNRARFIVGLGLAYNAVGIGAAFMGYISPLVAAVAMPIFSTILLLLSYTAFTGIPTNFKE
jgi:cation transport ATPase